MWALYTYDDDNHVSSSHYYIPYHTYKSHFVHLQGCAAVLTFGTAQVQVLSFNLGLCGFILFFIFYLYYFFVPGPPSKFILKLFLIPLKMESKSDSFILPRNSKSDGTHADTVYTSSNCGSPSHPIPLGDDRFSPASSFEHDNFFSNSMSMSISYDHHDTHPAMAYVSLSGQILECSPDFAKLFGE